ncbi:MAG TPA: NAD(P)/FAD-dependent oxidoreductase [Actinomycetaceae bacterium]|nr:NAD(P)/FAD-dependent oxidoreductase [Actinomycetaceae bacterium]
MDMDTPWDAVVVGGSAAGLAAALTLARSRRRVLVVDDGQPRNRFSPAVHGVVGHDGRPPGELLAAARAEAAGYGAAFRTGTVTTVHRAGATLTVVPEAGDPLAARALVVASGITDRLPDVPGLAPRWGRSVLHCPYCHGWEVRDRRLAVLLTSPLQLHQVELVRQLSADVVVCTGGLGTLDPEVERRWRARGITPVADPVVEVLGQGHVTTGLRTASGDVVPVDAVFVAPTPVPRDTFLAGLGLRRAERAGVSLLAVDGTGRTSDDRVWAAGNVVDPGANVAGSAAAGTLAGAAVNLALAGADTDAALEAVVGRG